jgi:hypothetical protein
MNGWASDLGHSAAARHDRPVGLAARGWKKDPASAARSMTAAVTSTTCHPR